MRQRDTATERVPEAFESYNVQPLGPHHDRAAFSCGVEVLDHYLQRQAGQDERKNIARVFVAEGPEPHIVAGYYTLSSYGIDVGDLPAAESKKLPRYPIVPAALIGRLAVGLPYRGTGLGAHLLLDALARIIDVNNEVATHAIVVDAKGEAAASFYRKYGFRPFPSIPLRLFLPTATAMAALSKK